MRLAILHARLRTEERLLLDACDALAIDAEPIDLRSVVFRLDDPGAFARFDVVLDRSVSLTASLTAVRILEGFGIRCVNPARTIEICSDKLRTSIALEAAGLPTPRVSVTTGPDAAIEAIEDMGYPVVLKPTVGSWGRLVARVNDRDAAEAVIEHRATLGSVNHAVLYVQEHIDKPGRDIRVFVIGGEPVAAIARSSGHWVTNTARGAAASPFEITPEIDGLCRRAAATVGADVVAIDLLECPCRGILINELNHSMEFRNSITPTGVGIPRLIIEHALSVATSNTLPPNATSARASA